MVGRRFALCSAIAVIAAMAVGDVSSSAAPKPQTISLLEVDTSFVGTGGFSTTGSSPPAVGQGFVSTGVLYKWAGAKKGAPAGRAQVVCAVTSVKISASLVWMHCDVSVFLSRGVIEVSGPLSLTTESNTVPVVGGTGAYVGAQGTVTHRNIDGQNSNKSIDVIRLTN
jgi:Dirigent-like protein